MTNLQISADEYTQILNLYSAYNHSSDEGDVEGYANCFTEDGELHGSADVVGRSELKEYKRAEKSRREHLYRRHWNGSIYLEKVDSDTIHGCCYIVGLNGEPGQLPFLTHAGVYTDIIKKVNDEWKFACRKIAFDGVKADPLSARR